MYIESVCRVARGWVDVGSIHMLSGGFYDFHTVSPEYFGHTLVFKFPTLTFDIKQFNTVCNFNNKYWPAGKAALYTRHSKERSIKLTFFLQTWRFNKSLFTPLLST
jgi:hypothetical protein